MVGNLLSYPVELGCAGCSNECIHLQVLFRIEGKIYNATPYRGQAVVDRCDYERVAHPDGAGRKQSFMQRRRHAEREVG
jgi:hypothetical protein